MKLHSKETPASTANIVFRSVISSIWKFHCKSCLQVEILPWQWFI